jgi:hypothetical protein
VERFIQPCEADYAREHASQAHEGRAKVLGSRTEDANGPEGWKRWKRRACRFRGGVFSSSEQNVVIVTIGFFVTRVSEGLVL